MTITEIRAHLLELAEERVVARRTGLSADDAYMEDLREEIVLFQMALVGAAVTEMAVERGERFGRQVG